MSRNTTEKGSITWQSSSNIALVKYWGKHGNQLPQNPSLSMTLQASHTITSVAYCRKSKMGEDVSIRFLFNGKPDKNFEDRIGSYLHSLVPGYPFLTAYDLDIQSRNTFPHSSGIASSASAFSALALCMMSLKEAVNGQMKKDSFFRETSLLARLGSGSACRSVYGGYVVWGDVEGMTGYSDEYAVPLREKIHPVFQSYCDAILIVSDEKKKVGSSAGHALMNHHPFAESRYRQANKHTVELIRILHTGDLNRFIEVVENEALTLHGLMMSSSPGYMLMKKETVEMIDRIREFRKNNKIPVAFTLDAGPNVHLLYPEMYREVVHRFIETVLKGLCANGQWIDDRIGPGPKYIKH